MTPTRIAIAGATGLIGRAVTRALLARDAELLLIARDGDALGRFAGGLDGKVHTAVADIGDLESARAALDGHNNLDGIVMPVGGTMGAGPFGELASEDTLAAFSGKYLSQLIFAQTALPHMKEDGAIVFFAGLMSRTAIETMSVMGSVNAAIEAMTRGVAKERPQLRVNCISPAQVKPASDRATDEYHIATADDVATLATALLLDVKTSGIVYDVPRTVGVI
jgi:NADP-dependent 3-hydroxy acid dehydrogenase YdfG